VLLWLACSGGWSPNDTRVRCFHLLVGVPRVNVRDDFKNAGTYGVEPSWGAEAVRGAGPIECSTGIGAKI